MNFDKIKREIRELSQGDGSEIKHIAEFVADIVDNVKYDCATGNYQGKAAQVLRTQILGSLDEMRASIEIIEKKVKEII